MPSAKIALDIKLNDIGSLALKCSYLRYKVHHITSSLAVPAQNGSIIQLAFAATTTPLSPRVVHFHRNARVATNDWGTWRPSCITRR